MPARGVVGCDELLAQLYSITEEFFLKKVRQNVQTE